MIKGLYFSVFTEQCYIVTVMWHLCVQDDFSEGGILGYLT